MKIRDWVRDHYWGSPTQILYLRKTMSPPYLATTLGYLAVPLLLPALLLVPPVLLLLFAEGT